MANAKPFKLSNNQIQQFQPGDTVGIDQGGTGATTAGGARSELGLTIGADVMAYSATLDALRTWSGTGILVGNGSGAWFSRQIATASSSRLTVTNPDGVSGNITLDLATVGSALSSNLYKITTDAYGRVTAGTAVIASDLTSILGSTYLQTVGGTLTGYLTLNGDPTNALHAASKQYVDNLFASGGIAPFLEVKVATTANITLSAPQTIDGISVVAGNRVLVKNQTTASQNGIYVVAAGAWTRATDADASAEFQPGRTVFVQQGNTTAFTQWAVSSAANPTIGTTSITFTQTGASQQYTAGNGLQLAGTQFSVIGVAGQISVTGSGVGLATSGVSAGTYTKVTFDVYGRATAGATATPSDIGAQASNANLTALAAYNTNGILVQTGTNTFAGRTLSTASASRITVTNGNGVSGNPTIDLATTGVSAGTYSGLTIDVYGRVTAAVASNISQNQMIDQNVLSNGQATAIVIGTPVYSSGSETVKKAIANSASTAKVIGLVASTSIAAAATGNILVGGILTATTGQWDAVTGQTGGLTVNAEYFVDNTTAGKLTSTAPTSSGAIAPVGIALSTTRMAVSPKRIILL